MVDLALQDPVIEFLFFYRLPSGVQQFRVPTIISSLRDAAQLLTDSVDSSCRDELGRFVADKRCLTCVKMEGCINLGGFVLNSPSLSTLWLSDLYSLSKMVVSSFLII